MRALMHHLSCKRGFSLFELLAVMMILGILASIAIPSYQRSQIRAREAVLAENLFQLRSALDAYYADRESYPDRLEQLSSAKYLRDIPVDPFTRNNTTWMCVPPELGENGQQAEGGCYDVVSGSELVGLNDLPYRMW
jgi:general secretion pathway protein G